MEQRKKMVALLLATTMALGFGAVCMVTANNNTDTAIIGGIKRMVSATEYEAIGPDLANFTSRF